MYGVVVTMRVDAGKVVFCASFNRNGRQEKGCGGGLREKGGGTAEGRKGSSGLAEGHSGQLRPQRGTAEGHARQLRP